MSEGRDARERRCEARRDEARRSTNLVQLQADIEGGMSEERRGEARRGGPLTSLGNVDLLLLCWIWRLDVGEEPAKQDLRRLGLEPLGLDSAVKVGFCGRGGGREKEKELGSSKPRARQRDREAKREKLYGPMNAMASSCLRLTPAMVCLWWPPSPLLPPALLLPTEADPFVDLPLVVAAKFGINAAAAAGFVTIDTLASRPEI